MSTRVDATWPKSLEVLLEAGEVEAVLLFKGDWTEAEKQAAREGWEIGLRQGKELARKDEQS